MIMDLSLITSQLNKSIWMMIIRSHNNIQVPKPFCVSFGWFGCIFVMVKKIVSAVPLEVVLEPIPFNMFNPHSSSLCCV